MTHPLLTRLPQAGSCLPASTQGRPSLLRPHRERDLPPGMSRLDVAGGPRDTVGLSELVLVRQRANVRSGVCNAHLLEARQYGHGHHR